ncbi:MAG: NAD/NADP octopine/nopaline dehydrogenase family protein [Nitrospinota bacterium]
MRIAVLGAGAGGLATAAHLSLTGHKVSIWSAFEEELKPLRAQGGVRATGVVEGVAKLASITADPAEALEGADLILLVTTSQGHAPVAGAIAPWVREGQVVVVCPGHTGGALEVFRIFRERGAPFHVPVAETYSLHYSSRIAEAGIVRVTTLKRTLPTAVLPARATSYAMGLIRQAYPQWAPRENALATSFQNVGGVLHVAPLILNAGRVESGQRFQHYLEGITPSVAQVVLTTDRERLAVARAYDASVLDVTSLLREVYGASGDSLEEVRQVYQGSMAPMRLEHRYLLEEIPFSFVPLSALAHLAGLTTPVTDSLVALGGALLGRDFWAEGRSLGAMGLEGLSLERVRWYVETGER